MASSSSYDEESNFSGLSSSLSKRRAGGVGGGGGGRGYRSGGYSDSEILDEDGESSCFAASLGIFVCFLLFLVVLMSVGYGTNGMYFERNMRPKSSYSNDRWWCYECEGAGCKSRCWMDT